jgi:hypothetical protein
VNSTRRVRSKGNARLRRKTVRDAVVTINDQDGSWVMKWSTGEKSGKGFMQLVNTYDFLKKVKNGMLNKTMRTALCQRQTAGQWKVLLRNTRGVQREQQVSGMDYNSAERAARKFMKDGEQVVSVTIASKTADMEPVPTPFHDAAMNDLFESEFMKMRGQPKPEIPGSNEIQELERRQRGRSREIQEKYPVKPILPIKDPFLP